ncbi:MAG: metal ABC transporter solute-binding protein, Zn/Mn family [Methanothermobacter sp.]
MTRIRKDRLILVIIIIIITAIILGYMAEERTSSVNNTDKIGVIVSIGPQVEFVKAVGGDKVDVTLMVPSTADVHTYEPLPSQLSNVASAKMYVEIGSSVEFETNYMDKLKSSNPSMLVVNSSKGIQFLPAEDADETIDPHVWVSPRNAKIMVENIYEGLVQIDPSNKDYYQKNRDEYLAKLDELDQNTTKLLENRTKPILIYHPAFAYYARDYNLTIIGAMVNDEEPSPQRIARMVDVAQEDNITVVYQEPQYSSKVMESIASQIGGHVIMVDILNENYLESMKNIAEAFSKS